MRLSKRFLCIKQRLGKLLILLLLGAAAPSSFAQGAAQEIGYPPELVSAVRCTGMRFFFIEIVMQGLKPRMTPKPATYTVTQVKEIVTELDDISQQFCKRMDAAIGTEFKPDGKGLADDRQWQRFLADDKARRWLHVNALFLAEIEPMFDYINLANALSPSQESPPPPSAEESQKLIKEIDLVSLTKNQTMARGMLHYFGAEPRLHQILPARFDLKRLVQIEAKTRAIGVPLLEKYFLSLEKQSRQMKADVSQGSTQTSIKTAERDAMGRLDKLVNKYAPRQAHN